MDPLLRWALDWYSHLARQPGWKAYVWDRVQAMAKEEPLLFWKLPDLLLEELQRDRNKDRSDRDAQKASA
jgi:hypothetical protein